MIVDILLDILNEVISLGPTGNSEKYYPPITTILYVKPEIETGILHHFNDGLGCLSLTETGSEPGPVVM